jgi:Ca2+-binding EF-hand superfamily protein
MDKEQIFVSEKDVVLLINRFDKDEDQKVSYVEFIQEIAPKSKKKY